MAFVEMPAPAPSTTEPVDLAAVINQLNSTSGSRAEPKIKMVSVTDPSYEAEIPSPSAVEEKQHFDHYSALKQGEPEVESEPTADQIAAMNTRSQSSSWSLSPISAS